MALRVHLRQGDPHPVIRLLPDPNLRLRVHDNIDVEKQSVLIKADIHPTTDQIDCECIMDASAVSLVSTRCNAAPLRSSSQEDLATTFMADWEFGWAGRG